jgi:phospholipase/carboxylesterase
MHQKNIVLGGMKLGEAQKALIMIHGRGASAADILSLSAHLDVKEFSLLAPQATNNTWYPYSFLAPTSANEPWLSSALALLKDVVNDVVIAGVAKKDIYFLGFSQGACLMLEFITRNAERYGGAAAFTGGLIGETIDSSVYQGDFGGMPLFIGTSDPDPHVPVSRVNETVEILKNMKAAVTVKIYSGMGHTITQDEIDKANSTIFTV